MLASARRYLLVLACTTGLVAAGPGPAGAAADWRTGETSWRNPRAHAPKVVGLRFARHEGFDRVVVDISGHRPGYQTLFADKLSYDPSARPVPLKGKYKMYLVLRPAATYSADGTGLYDGPVLERPDFPSLKGIALTGSWEGDTSLGFTSRTRPYRVFTLTDPSRVVVDFRHPAG
jgi:hypothetical protein